MAWSTDVAMPELEHRLIGIESNVSATTIGLECGTTSSLAQYATIASIIAKRILGITIPRAKCDNANMLRKFRRNSKDAVEVLGSQELAANGSTSTTSTNATMANPERTRLTFFDMPAEIRNIIYEMVIRDAILTIPLSAPSKKSKLPLMRRRTSAVTPINGLLLTSRQCRAEYLGVLLSGVIPVVVDIKDFDFEHLIRVSAGLRETEIAMLQANRNLTLQLHTLNCTSKNLLSLRRWLDHRREDATKLPWRYSFPMDRLLPPTTMGRVRLLRELEYYVDAMSALTEIVEGSQQDELQQIVGAFEREANWLEDDLGWLGQRSKSNPRSLRGLAGGGVV